jgi:hypothetical protein
MAVSSIRVDERTFMAKLFCFSMTRLPRRPDAPITLLWSMYLQKIQKFMKRLPPGHHYPLKGNMREKPMDNDAQRELSPAAFQVWIGQWRLASLDCEGCMFVLRFLLRAFRNRRSEDNFWRFLEEFLFSDAEQFSDEEQEDADDYERGQTAKDLLVHAGSLNPDQARALMAYLSQCYASDADRLFWNTVSEAIQLYTVAPYPGRAAGTA